MSISVPTPGQPVNQPANLNTNTAAPEPDAEPETSSDPWLQQRLNYIASIAPPPSPSSSSGGVS
jgi:hypothetical protein